MAVTIKDIAREAQVDKAAVSLTLNDRPGANRLRPETRERIRQAARSLGYRRNLLAASTRTGVVKTIAVLGRFSRHEMPSEVDRMLAGIMGTATKNGYNVKVYQDGPDESIFEEIDGNQIQLVVSLSVEQDIRRLTAEHCRKFGLHLVYVYEHSVDEFPSVNTDNFASAREVVRHLASLGHRRIGLLCVPHRYRYIEERHAGFTAGMHEAGLAVDPDWIDCSDCPEEAVKRMLSLPVDRRPTAFFGISDFVAAMAERAVIRSGLRIPEDISIFGFGNCSFCNALFVPLASIEESSYQRGAMAIELLLGLPISIAPTPDRRYLIPPQLVLRGSVAPVAASSVNEQH